MQDVNFKLFGISLAAINSLLSLLVIYSIRTLIYEKLIKKLEEFIRVDHTEKEVQLKFMRSVTCLKYSINDEDLKKTISEMKKHEKNIVILKMKLKRDVNPTKFLPLWVTWIRSWIWLNCIR